MMLVFLFLLLFYEIVLPFGIVTDLLKWPAFMRSIFRANPTVFLSENLIFYSWPLRDTLILLNYTAVHARIFRI